MPEKFVDARGLECPQPVVLTRNAMMQPGIDEVHVFVSSDIQAENIQRMARTEGWNTASHKQGNEIEVIATRSGAPAEAQAAPATRCASRNGSDAPVVAVFVSSDLFGSGDDELGRILMRAFIKTIKDLEPLPSKVIFANAGVRLTTEGSSLLEDLQHLESSGIQIISCGTCLDYFHLIDKLKVGVASNMYEIAQSLVDADRVVRP